MAESEKSGTRSFAAVVVALVVVVAGVLLVVRSGSAPEPAPESGPQTTTVYISSEPAGATVTTFDGGVLGVTPFEITVPKRAEDLPVIVRLGGYQEQRSSIPLFSASGRVDVMLTAVGQKPPAPPKPPPDGWAP